MYTQAFEDAVNHAMLYEVGGHWNVDAPGVRDGTSKKGCGYVNDPVDPGGETKFGVAKNANPDLDVKNLDWEGAKAVYYRRYWLNASCDKLPGRIAVLHFDGCVNHGVGRGNKILQTALGVGQDGVIGDMTLSKANEADPIEVCNDICNQREMLYRNIVAKNPSQGKYLGGWLRRISEMRDFTTEPSRDFA